MPIFIFFMSHVQLMAENNVSLMIHWQVVNALINSIKPRQVFTLVYMVYSATGNVYTLISYGVIQGTFVITGEAAF